MITRRGFLERVVVAGAGLGLVGMRPMGFFGGVAGSKVLTIMHTNDTHARIDPFPEGAGVYEGLGGVVRRAALIRKIRSENGNSLLLDAGDVFQGTPYFNFYHGALDLELMSMMGYDATTVGNHEFDNKVKGFVNVAHKANFPYLISNYDFAEAPAMGAFTSRFTIRKMAGVRVGIFGLGVAFENLVLPELHEGVRHLDALEVAGKMVWKLRREQSCEMVICLSHLGLEYTSEQVSDRVIAREVEGIDLIIGGHTHTLLERPVVWERAVGRPTVISQVGHAGVVLGRLDFEFDRRNRIRRLLAGNQRISENDGRI